MSSDREALIGVLEVLADEVGALRLWATEVERYTYRPDMAAAMRERAVELAGRCEAIRDLLESTEAGQ